MSSRSSCRTSSSSLDSYDVDILTTTNSDRLDNSSDYTLFDGISINDCISDNRVTNIDDGLSDEEFLNGKI